MKTPRDRAKKPETDKPKQDKKRANYLASMLAGNLARELARLSREVEEHSDDPNALAKLRTEGLIAISRFSTETVGSTNRVSELRAELIRVLTSEARPALKRASVARLTVDFLQASGRFYHHAERRDFDSALYFDNQTKRLERIRGDAFQAWLADTIAVNRADPMFRYAAADVETAALASKEAAAIVPASYWCSRPGAVYLSCGDGAVVRINPDAVELVDNGTDQVLFAAGRSLAPWKLTDPQDPFCTCSLFSDAHTEARDLLRVWIYSLPTAPRCKPPLCLPGDVGSGKTRLARGITELYGLPFVAAKVEETGESDFWPNLDNGGVYILDNADTRCRWLPDAISAASTDGSSRRRKLYSNAETVTLSANSWLIITSANPSFGSDPGLADRLTIVRMERRDAETSDTALGDEIRLYRDASLSFIASTLQTALADRSPTPHVNDRHPDWAAFAVRIGRALDREVEIVTALQAAETDKSAFLMENHPVGAALMALLQRDGSFDGLASVLCEKLRAVDTDLAEWLTPKRMGRKLQLIWPHVQKACKTASKETAENGAWYRFKAKKSW